MLRSHGDQGIVPTVKNTTFLKSEPTQAWLGQFAPNDQGLVSLMLARVSLISRDTFAERLRELIAARIRSGEGPVGLYAEREVPKRNRIPNRLFKEKKTAGHIRAHGKGPDPVAPLPAYTAAVGSEGIVSQLISEFCKLHPTMVFSHPGPSKIRDAKIRRFILVTDFIGSGERVSDYLSAAWRVKSVKSWHSTRSRKGMAFEIAAFSATEAGKKLVERHPCAPLLSLVTLCPTIDSEFSDAVASEIKAVCFNYCPTTKDEPLGHGNVGALIAFAHGAPNNMPAIFHRKSRKWSPLFQSRVTSSVGASFKDAEVDTAEVVQERLIAMRQGKLAQAALALNAPRGMLRRLLVMAALMKGPRRPEIVSRRTRLTLMEIADELAVLLKNGWIDGSNIPTNLGREQVNKAKKSAARPGQLPNPKVAPYYPSQLRAPGKV